jgi:hypothetical protein
MDAAGDAFVAKAFQDLLGRPAEPAAVSYYGGLLDQGTSRTQLVLDIENTQEYLTDYVEMDYTQYLHRAADPGGLANGIQILQNTGNPESLLSLLTSSSEYFQTRGGNTNNGYLNALFEDFLDRPVEPSADIRLHLRYFRSASRGGE